MQEVNKLLEKLIGLRITHTNRVVDMQCFTIGTFNLADSKNQINIENEFSLHIQAPWRFTNESQILIGSNDLYEQSDETAEYDSNFNWDVKNANLRDVKINKLLSKNNLLIETAIIDSFGGLILQFKDNLKLTIFPNISSKSENEFWRLLDNIDESKRHLVTRSTGIEGI